MSNLKRCAAQALAVQNACNLSGVVYSFADAVKVLRSQPDCTGTEYVNRHPISVLFAVQIAHLTGVGSDLSLTDYSKAREACEALAASEEATNLMSVKDIGHEMYKNSLR